MGLGEKAEQIDGLSLYTFFPDHPGGDILALILDRPAFNPAGLENWFSPREMAEGRGKTAPAAHRAWLLGRLAAKAAASARWGRSPSAAEISSAADGRPLLTLTDGPEGATQVSISHTGGAAAALAGAGPVGVDLELASRPMTERMRNWAFTPAERRLAAEAAESGWPGPLALWCAREAAAKSWGRALLNHLEEVRVAEADWTEGRLAVDWLGPGARRGEIRLKMFNGFLLALTGDSPLTLKTTKVEI